MVTSTGLSTVPPRRPDGCAAIAPLSKWLTQLCHVAELLLHRGAVSSCRWVNKSDSRMWSASPLADLSRSTRPHPHQQSAVSQSEHTCRLMKRSNCSFSSSNFFWWAACFKFAFSSVTHQVPNPSPTLTHHHHSSPHWSVTHTCHSFCCLLSISVLATKAWSLRMQSGNSSSLTFWFKIREMAGIKVWWSSTSVQSWLACQAEPSSHWLLFS